MGTSVVACRLESERADELYHASLSSGACSMHYWTERIRPTHFLSLCLLDGHAQGPLVPSMYNISMGTCPLTEAPIPHLYGLDVRTKPCTFTGKIYFGVCGMQRHKMEISTATKVRSLLVREMYSDNGTLSPRSLQY